MAENDDAPKLNTNVSSFKSNRRGAILKQVIDNNIRYTGDGEECFDKAIGYGITGGVFGTIYGTLYVALAYERPQPVMYHPVLRTIAKIGTSTFTVAGASTMFAVGSCYAASIRGKDEAKNQLFGGVGAGLVIGAKFRSITAAIVTSILSGAIATSIVHLDLHKGIDTFVPETIKHIPDNRYGWQAPRPKDVHATTISSRSDKDLAEWYESKKQWK